MKKIPEYFKPLGLLIYQECILVVSTHLTHNSTFP